MKSYITITQKLAPFSHTPGIRAFIPKTDILVKAFPTRIEIGEKEILLPISGPVKDFTLQVDLEREILKIFGEAKEGFFCLFLFVENGVIYLYVERAPPTFPFALKTKIPQFPAVFSSENREKLSLGVHRSQEWELMARRADLNELLPFWLKMAQIFPRKETDNVSVGGNFSLLQQCQDDIRKKDKLSTQQNFLNLFRAAFSDLLIPQLNDPHYLGLSKSTSDKVDPAPLLTKSGELIRSFFFQEEDGNVSFLPFLPPLCHAGRFTNILTSFQDEIDMEWSKKQLKKLIIKPSSSRQISLLLPNEIKSFRLRRSLQEKGEIVKVGVNLALEAKVSFYFDHFQK